MASLDSWLPNPTTSSWGRPSSRSAIGCIRSEPRSSKPPSTCGKHGVPRVQHELSDLPGLEQVPGPSQQDIRLPDESNGASGGVPTIIARPVMRVMSRWTPPWGFPHARTQAELGAKHVAAMAATINSFADAAEKFLPKMAGLRLFESTWNGPTKMPATGSATRGPTGILSAPMPTGVGTATRTGGPWPTSVSTPRGWHAGRRGCQGVPPHGLGGQGLQPTVRTHACVPEAASTDGAVPSEVDGP